MLEVVGLIGIGYFVGRLCSHGHEDENEALMEALNLQHEQMNNERKRYKERIHMLNSALTQYEEGSKHD